MFNQPIIIDHAELRSKLQHKYRLDDESVNAFIIAGYTSATTMCYSEPLLPIDVSHYLGEVQVSKLASITTTNIKKIISPIISNDCRNLEDYTLDFLMCDNPDIAILLIKEKDPYDDIIDM